jgi:hypothetical protein
LKIQEAITELGWTILPHPPHSPHLGHSDFHPSGALKDTIQWQRFGMHDDVTAETKKWLRVQNSNQYKKGIYVVSCWRKTVEVGDYVEK